jgi:Replication initiation factor
MRLWQMSDKTNRFAITNMTHIDSLDKGVNAGFELPTAVCHTRSNSLSMVHNLCHHQDWLTVTGYVTRLDMVECLIDKYFATRVDWSGGKAGIKGKGWQQIAAAPNGVRLCYNFLDGSLGYEVLLEIPGKPITEVTGDEAWELCRELYQLGMRATRFDWAIDDYARGLSLSDIYSSYREGAFARVRKMQVWEECKAGSMPVLTGFTCGSRQSEKYIRIYDKLIESKGAIDCVRFEVEFKGAKAEALFAEFSAAPTVEAAFDLAAKYAVGSIDFIDRTDKNLDRCPVAAWWSSFVEAVGGRKRMSIPRLKKDVASIIKWHEKQVARSMALLAECKGVNHVKLHLLRLVHQGREKFGNYERIFVETFKAHIARPYTGIGSLAVRPTTAGGMV